VGLDVVRRAVLALQGLVEVVSTPGSGTRIVLRLPQTLTVTRGLVVRQGGNLFAFPLHSIVGVRTLGESRTQTAGRGLGRGGRDGEAAVPLLDLGRFFGMQPGEMARASRRSVVLAGVAEKRVGIVVEKIVSQEELLVRALGPLIATHPGLSGVAELAGGQLALVVDITAAIAFAAGERNSGAEVAGTMGKETRG
jgi:two-component system chemotaxis sensor kinase CheA